MEKYQKLFKKLEGYKTIALTLHQGPDLDSLCSNYVFSIILESMNKKVLIFGGEDFEMNAKKFSQFDEIFARVIPESISQYTGKIDLLCTLDISRFDRVHKNFKPGDYDHVNIDHHAGNIFTDKDSVMNILDRHASSTCEMIYQFGEVNRISLNDECMKALFAGIHSDTMSFSIGMSSNTFNVLSKITERINISEISQILNQQWDFNEIKNLIKKTLDNTKYYKNNRIIFACIEFRGMSMDDIKKIFTHMKYDILIIAVRKADGFRISVVTQSNAMTSALSIAQSLGGNGHVHRAGAFVSNISRSGIEAQIEKILGIS